MKRILLAAAVALVLAASGPALGVTITFDEPGIAHGTVLDTQFAALTPPTVVDILVDNPTGPDLAVAFSTTTPAGMTTDTDLLGPSWSTGNISTDTQLGNLMIVQENNLGCATGTCEDPDDEANASVVELVLSCHLDSFGFDFVDVDSASAEAGGVRFYDGETTVEVSWSDFAAGGTYDQGALFGDNSLNRVMVTAAQLGLTKIDGIEFLIGGSIGLDNLVLSRTPEPGTAALMLIGVSGLFVAGRRRRA